MKTGIKVGPDKDSVGALEYAIVHILDCGRDREVTIAALKTLREGTRVTNTTISGCYFSGAVEEDNGD